MEDISSGPDDFSDNEEEEKYFRDSLFNSQEFHSNRPSDLSAMKEATNKFEFSTLFSELEQLINYEGKEKSTFEDLLKKTQRYVKDCEQGNFIQKVSEFKEKKISCPKSVKKTLRNISVYLSSNKALKKPNTRNKFEAEAIETLTDSATMFNQMLEEERKKVEEPIQSIGISPEFIQSSSDASSKQCPCSECGQWISTAYVDVYRCLQCSQFICPNCEDTDRHPHPNMLKMKMTPPEPQKQEFYQPEDFGYQQPGYSHVAHPNIPPVSIVNPEIGFGMPEPMFEDFVVVNAAPPRPEPVPAEPVNMMNSGKEDLLDKRPRIMNQPDVVYGYPSGRVEATFTIKNESNHPLPKELWLKKVSTDSSIFEPVSDASKLAPNAVRKITISFKLPDSLGHHLIRFQFFNKSNKSLGREVIINAQVYPPEAILS